MSLGWHDRSAGCGRQGGGEGNNRLAVTLADLADIIHCRPAFRREVGCHMDPIQGAFGFVGAADRIEKASRTSSVIDQ